MKVLIIEPNQSSEFDNALKQSNSFVRFHSPQCGHCIAMKEEMEKLKKHSDLKDIEDLNIIDAHTGVTRHSNHPVCNMHDGAVPAMYIVIKGEKPEEYEGDRSADAMARFIGDKIGGYNKMKGGKKQKKQVGGIGDELSGALVPAPERLASPIQVPQPNFGTYEVASGDDDIPNETKRCETLCGDHSFGHGFTSMVGLGDLTHATCEGEDEKQHKCKKPQSGGKKRKTRKHKKKAKKAHKKKTHKRKPKRKTRKHKKKAKKTHKKKTHKRRNVRHSTRKKGGVKSVRSKTPSRTSNLSVEDRKELKRRQFGQKKIEVLRPDGQGQGRTTWTGETPKTEPCCTKCDKSLCNKITCSGVKQCAECNSYLEPSIIRDNFSLIPSYRMMDCMPPGEIIE